MTVSAIPERRSSSISRLVRKDSQFNHTLSSSRRASTSKNGDVGKPQHHRLLTSVDESHAVGAWVTFHLLVDLRHKLLRETLRHWFRLALFDDLSRRLRQVQPLEKERQGVLEKIDALEVAKKSYVDKEQLLVDEAKQQMVRADTTEKTVEELRERLEASEARESKLRNNYLGLLDETVRLNSLTRELADVKPVSEREIMEFFSHIASETNAPEHRRMPSGSADMKKRTFTEDVDIFTERRRRSHLASPGVHLVPSSSFLDSSLELVGVGGLMEVKGEGAVANDDVSATKMKTEEGETKEDAEEGKEVVVGEEKEEEKEEEEEENDVEKKEKVKKEQVKKDKLPKRHTSTPQKANPTRVVKSGPVRPSHSSTTGVKTSVKVNEADEKLWEKINEPRSETGNTVAVAVRVRPFNQREKDMGAELCVQMSDKSIALVEPTSKGEGPCTAIRSLFDYL